MKDVTPPRVIDHNEHEFTARETAGIWWGCAALLAFLWTWFLYFHAPNWISFGIGFATALIFCSWVYDITGGKVPKSWRTPRS